MEITGKLMQILPEQRGESSRGPWARGGFVIETEEQYPRKIAFSLWGEDKLTALKNIPIGNTIKVTFNIESREYNERWYTDCRCQQIDIFTAATPQSGFAQGYPNQPYGQMPQQSYQMPPQQNAYQQPPQMPQPPTQQAAQPTPPPTMPQGGGTIEQEGMDSQDDENDLPF